MRRILERVGLIVATIAVSLLVIVGQRHSIQALPAFIQFAQSLASPGEHAQQEHGGAPQELTAPLQARQADGTIASPAAAQSIAGDVPVRILNVRFVEGTGVARIIFDLDRPAVVHADNDTAGDLVIAFDNATLEAPEERIQIPFGSIVSHAKWKSDALNKSALTVKLSPLAQYQVASYANPERIVADFSLPEAADFLPDNSDGKASHTIADPGGLMGSLGLGVKRIVIDPGHGGKDEGATGPGGLKEKDVALDVARRLQRILSREYGLEAILTRTDDRYVPLEQRVEFANRNKADLFISLHVNSADTENSAVVASSRGIETYSLSLSGSPDAMRLAARENKLSNQRLGDLSSLVTKIALAEVEKSAQTLSARLAASLSASISLIDPSTGRNRGARSAPFLVLVGAKMPASLIELPFISNPMDEALLKNESFRERMARSVAEGLAGFNIAGRTSNARGTP